jgi:hypothetical protein
MIQKDQKLKLQLNDNQIGAPGAGSLNCSAEERIGARGEEREYIRLGF